MVELLMLLGWLVTSGVAFRYTGYTVNTWSLRHSISRTGNICMACKCVRCGRKRTNHYSYEKRPYNHAGDCTTKEYDNDPADWRGMHVGAILFGGVMAVLWPVTLFAFGALQAAKASGLTQIRFQYFKPPPEIRSREERRIAREEAKDERIKALEARNLELEEELGIGASDDEGVEV